MRPFNEIALTLAVLLKQHSEKSLSSPVLGYCVDRISKDDISLLDQCSDFGILQFAQVSRAPFVTLGEKQQSEWSVPEPVRSAGMCLKLPEELGTALCRCVATQDCRQVPIFRYNLDPRSLPAFEQV